MLKPFKRAFAGEFQTGNVLLDSPIDVLQIDAKVIVDQDISKPRQPFPINRRMRHPDGFAQPLTGFRQGL